jgi:23S rRNA pseudouridine1911/1915/1917 synthase
VSAGRQRRREVAPEAAGERLDLWLSRIEAELSRSRVQKLIDAGLVLVDDRLRPASFRLRGGELVRWEIPPAEPTELCADLSVDFSIRFEDGELAVIEKPAGLVVHPGPGHRQGTLLHGLLARLSSLSEVGGRARPGLVHRLDRDTSGLLVVAKTDRAHLALVEQLRRRELKRGYIALCWGRPAAERASLDYPLGRHPGDRKRRAVVAEGRPARTDYELKASGNGASLLSLSLHTGRTHQIRVHLAHIGHPVLGDELYGGGDDRLRGAAPAHRASLALALGAIGRQALHACELCLRHPISGAILEFRSDPPPPFTQACRVLFGTTT